jgi:hypothetical protein
MKRKLGIVAALVVLAALSTGVAAATAASQGAGAPPLPQGSEPANLDPADFVSVIENPYWPMKPGTRWVYRETDEEGNVLRVKVTVTTKTKTILGIQATVVHDIVTENGEVKEDTYDWYAQDRWGNVWYLGEDTKEYENGKVVTTAGSWEAGVDGAEAGVVVPGTPQDGMTYRQEYYAGEAEDAAEVLSVNEQAQVPYGHFTDVLLTKDYTPLHPRILEYKLYARGIGPVLVLGISGGGGQEELVRFKPGA